MMNDCEKCDWIQEKKHIMVSLEELKEEVKEMRDLITSGRLKMASIAVINSIATSAITGLVVYLVTKSFK